MFGKAALEAVLGKLRVGGLTVQWWDGSKKSYGPGKPVATLALNDPSVVGRMLRNMSLGFSECYMDGLIEIEGDIRDLIILAHQNRAAFPKLSHRTFGSFVRGVTLAASAAQSRQDISHHYDRGNDFYALWLDETMIYSCAYFKKKTDTLKEAQLQKIDHTLKKLQLQKGMRLLDIGSGWGWLILTAAKRYGVHTHGITHSKEQLAKTRARIKAEGLEQLVTVELRDYRELTGTEMYDRIVSVGMYEHVGRPNQRQYFETVTRLLKPGGISLLHTITKHLELPMDPMISKHIFPGTYVPSWREVINFLPEYDLHLTDVESLRRHYAMTVDHWSKNYEREVEKVREMFDEHFVRMWRLYLRGGTTAFELGTLDLHQFVFTKGITNDLPLTREYLYR
ncbi:class I SAM-dependent methyltransferase [Candidatus Berkelbacteria bacterium]|nr:class I SAM-dependent methyltransferase [Candidatus Berkelbacteria bacterium]